MAINGLLEIAPLLKHANIYRFHLFSLMLLNKRNREYRDIIAKVNNIRIIHILHGKMRKINMENMVKRRQTSDLICHSQD